MKIFVIDEYAYQDLLRYLGQKPYSEVGYLMRGLEAAKSGNVPEKPVKEGAVTNEAES